MWVRHAYIADVGFRRDNAVLAAIATELAMDCQPITLRGLFYRIVSVGFFPSTAPEHYKRLGRVMSTLREREIIPYSWIIDNLRSTIKPSSWPGLNDFTETVRDAYRMDFWARLPEYVHIFTEKDAIAGVIEPVTREYDVPLSPVRGYCSDSFAHLVGAGWNEILKPINAYYLGDFDPSGFDIARDLEGKLRKHAHADTREAADLPISWHRLGINECDFDRFDLVALDVKRTDKRSRAFVEQHGERCAEVDALPPQELRRRVENAITAHIPRDRWERLKEIENCERESFGRLLVSMEDAAA